MLVPSRSLRRLGAGCCIGVMIALLTAILTGCAPATSPLTAPATSIRPVPTGETGETGDRIVLERAPDGLACDTIGISFRSVTFEIDPALDPQVRATTDRGATLRVLWDSTFVGGPVDDPSVLDKAGIVVARDGEVLPIPAAAWPSLHGHFVCPSETALYVLDEPAPR